jgi:hypothetical protein
MKRSNGIALLGVLMTMAAGNIWGQRLQWHSEFQRFDPTGTVLAVDRSSHPREILSPAVMRNAVHSFRLTVRPPVGEYYYLYVVQNPESTVKFKLYREIFEKTGEQWVPDRLEPIEIPYTSRIPDLAQPIPELSTETFWLDIEVSKDVQPQRFRAEAQMNYQGQWVIVPIEMRIFDTTIPDFEVPRRELPEVNARVDTAALNTLADYLCTARAGKATVPVGPQLLTVRGMVQRNALQDVALARSIEARHGGKDYLWEQILKITGAPSREAWCELKMTPEQWGAEWYLRVRDFLLRAGKPLHSHDP